MAPSATRRRRCGSSAHLHTRRLEDDCSGRAARRANPYRRPTAAGPIRTRHAQPERSLARGPRRALRKGRTRLPSLDVPSPNGSTGSPSASRWAISLFTSRVLCRQLRSTKTERCSRANSPNTGHAATSCLASEDDRRHRRDDGNVEPRGVVGDDEQRVVHRPPACGCDPKSREFGIWFCDTNLECVGASASASAPQATETAAAPPS